MASQRSVIAGLPRKEYFRRWAQAHKLTEAQKAQRRKTRRLWRLRNPELAKAASLRQRLTQVCKDRMRSWAKAHRDVIKGYGQRQRAKLKTDPVRCAAERERQRLCKAGLPIERKREAMKMFKAAKPMYFRDWKRAALQKPRYVLENNIRSRLHQAMTGYRKSAKTLVLLGCSIPELKAHLERQFLPGMTWANRSAWHIDHIRPCSSFDLLDPEQQRCCFHFSNLQPLWAADNLRKSDKWANV